MTRNELVFDWNEADMPMSEICGLKGREISIQDETMRDGRQSTYISVDDITIRHKTEILDILYELGIHSANIGFPGSSNEEKLDVIELAKYAQARHMFKETKQHGGLSLTCAARTHLQDIIPIIDASCEASVPLEVGMFIRCSELGALVQGWKLDDVLRKIAQSVRYATDAGLPVMFVAEDATRSVPSTLSRVCEEALTYGASRICIADTVGYIEYEGLSKIVRFLKDKFAGSLRFKLDFHGHNDFASALSNALYAYKFGVDRVHATFAGIGERSGNTPLDLLLVKLDSKGAQVKQGNLRYLREYLNRVCKVVGYELPPNYPIFGSRALASQTGVHSEAYEHAERLGFDDIKSEIYCPVNPERYGCELNFKVGAMSGGSTVRLVFRQLGISPTEERVRAVLTTAKTRRRILDETEIRQIVLEADLESQVEAHR